MLSWGVFYTVTAWLIFYITKEKPSLYITRTRRGKQYTHINYNSSDNGTLLPPTRLQCKVSAMLTHWACDKTEPHLDIFSVLDWSRAALHCFLQVVVIGQDLHQEIQL